MIHVAEQSALHDAVVGGLVDRAVAALVANLQNLARLLGGLRHALAAFHVPRHHLFAEHVLAGLEAADRDLGVLPERQADEHRLEILLLEHVGPLDIMRGFGQLPLLQRLVGALQRGGIDVADRANRAVGGIDVVEERASLASDADDAQPTGPPDAGAS